jgi:hypothetical protein
MRQMSSRLRAAAQTLPVLVPVALIIVGNFFTIEWMRFVGSWSLAAVVFLAVMRGRMEPVREAVSVRQLAIVGAVLVVLLVAPFLPHAGLEFLVLPFLVGSLAALTFVISYMVYFLVRAHRGA